MRPLHYVELRKILDKIKGIEGMYIDKVYKHEDEKYVIVLRAKGVKRNLVIFIGKALYFLNDFIREKDDFSEKLKKFLRGKKVLEVSLLKANRIIKIDFGNISLYLEFFRPGNIIITDSSGKIIEAYLYKDFGIRKIARGINYMVPNPGSIDPFELSYDTFKSIVINSGRKDIVRTLILDLTLGKIYANEILYRSNVDPNTDPKKLSEKEIKNIYESLISILEENRYFLYSSDFSFCELRHLDERGKEFDDPIELLVNVYEKKKIERERDRVIDRIKQELERMEELVKLVDRNKSVLKYVYDSLQAKKKIEDVVREVKNYFGITIDIERVDKYKFRIKFLSESGS